MGDFEDRIVTSLVALRDAEPDCERAMFVFPITLMAVERDLERGGSRTIRDGVVTMVCRLAE